LKGGKRTLKQTARRKRNRSVATRLKVKEKNIVLVKNTEKGAFRKGKPRSYQADMKLKKVYVDLRKGLLQ